MRAVFQFVVAVMLGMAVSPAVFAQATEKTLEIDLPAQPLDTALRAVSEKYGMQVLFNPNDVKGVVIAPVKGTYTPSQLLRKLVEGTHLTAVHDGKSAIAVRPRERTSRPAPEATSAAPGAAPQLEKISVSATRIDRAFDAPTPTIGLDSERLREGARPNIAAALLDLPQFRASAAPQVNGGSFTAGTTSIDMRGLGIVRTLVLLDGKRIVGDNDLSLVPSVLVKRVDVVTGSAAAAWGSGAVAGVVNILPDYSLEGSRAAAQAGVSSRGDARENRLEAAHGGGFAGGKGHVIVGGEFVDSEGLQPKTVRENAARWAVVPNPAFTATNGQSRSIIAPDVGIANVSPGGLILSGVNAGFTFNPDGTLRRFDLGRVSGTNSIGGEAPSLDDVAALAAPYSRYAALGHVSYELTPSTRLTAEIRNAKLWTDYNFLPDSNRGNITIQATNAFLPAEIRSQMAAANQASFTMGRFNDDFAFTGLDSERRSTQATLGMDGTLGDRWRWSAYYSRGRYSEDFDISRARLTANFNSAVDAVIDPATGQPACRINIDTNPNNNDARCVPINLFGYGRPSEAASAYVTGNSFSHTKRQLDLGAITLRGEPVDLPAGEVSVAGGLEARRDTIDVTSSALDQAGAFAFNNFFPSHGGNTTKEGFAEALVPVIRGPALLRLLEVNGAARLTRDATGSIWSWKAGITNKVTDDVQIRFARSRDIRAPSLDDLFGRRIRSILNVTDPATGSSYFTESVTGANPSLKPEASLTTTFGVVAAPRWTPGLRLTADYFKIDIGNAIATLGAQEIVSRCRSGNQELCGAIVRDSSGRITEINASRMNLARLTTSGVDATLDYALPLKRVAGHEGTLRLSGTFTWVKEYKQDDGVVALDFLGSQNTITQVGIPKKRWTATLAYEGERINASVRGRYISSGYYNKLLDIQNNGIASYLYVDLGLSYRLRGPARSDLQLYLNVNNAFDKDPPIESRNTPTYDVIGRYYVLGVRVHF